MSDVILSGRTKSLKRRGSKLRRFFAGLLLLLAKVTDHLILRSFAATHRMTKLNFVTSLMMKLRNLVKFNNNELRDISQPVNFKSAGRSVRFLGVN